MIYRTVTGEKVKIVFLPTKTSNFFLPVAGWRDRTAADMAEATPPIGSTCKVDCSARRQNDCIQADREQVLAGELRRPLSRVCFAFGAVCVLSLSKLCVLQTDDMSGVCLNIVLQAIVLQP